MKVVIFCGGLGTRMKEETEYRPKPMVNIGGKPILWHIMKTYSHYGFNEFVLCLGYKGDVIKRWFHDYEMLNNDFTVKGKDVTFHGEDVMNWSVTLADTGERALKGARLNKVEKYIDDDSFMATYGDGVGNVDIHELLRWHEKMGKICTVTGVRPPARFGILSENDGVVERFIEKKQMMDEFVSGGFFVMNREIFDYLDTDDDCELETGVLDNLAEEGKLAMYKHLGRWMCMDTQRDMELLNDLWRDGKAFWKVWE